jgi:hypothetical protein
VLKKLIVNSKDSSIETMKRFISSKLIVALMCSLAMLSFVSAQQSSTTTSNDKRSRLRGFNEERHHVLWDVIEEENRGLKKVNDCC